MRKRRASGFNLSTPIANISFAMMHRYVRSLQRYGVSMMHTARSFGYYRKVFYKNQAKTTVLASLEGKRIVDVGCGYTPFAEDSMFRVCHDAGIEFYGVDPLSTMGPSTKYCAAIFYLFGLKKKRLSPIFWESFFVY